MTRRSPLAPRISPQTRMPATPQPREGRERLNLYRAICKLRTAGFDVFRAGRHHMVDGRILSDRDVFLIAKTVR